MTNPNDFTETLITRVTAKYVPDFDYSIFDYQDDPDYVKEGQVIVNARIGEAHVELILDRGQRKQFEKFWRLAVTAIYNATVQARLDVHQEFKKDKV
jgi:hypothetical protein